MHLKFFSGLSLLAFFATAVGCTTTRDLYYWGGYEGMLNAYYSRPGDMTAARQIEILQQDVIDAKNRGLRVGPGIYAHLGLALADVGNVDGAKAAFSKEVELYPESEHMLASMIARADKANAAKKGTAKPNAVTPPLNKGEQ